MAFSSTGYPIFLISWTSSWLSFPQGTQFTYISWTSSWLSPPRVITLPWFHYPCQTFLLRKSLHLSYFVDFLITFSSAGHSTSHFLMTFLWLSPPLVITPLTFWWLPYDFLLCKVPNFSHFIDFLMTFSSTSHYTPHFLMTSLWLSFQLGTQFFSFRWLPQVFLSRWVPNFSHSDDFLKSFSPTGYPVYLHFVDLLMAFSPTSHNTSLISLSLPDLSPPQVITPLTFWWLSQDFLLTRSPTSHFFIFSLDKYPSGVYIIISIIIPHKGIKSNNLPQFRKEPYLCPIVIVIKTRRIQIFPQT